MPRASRAKPKPEPEPEQPAEATATIEDVQAGVDQYLETSRRELDRREIASLTKLAEACLGHDHQYFSEGPLYDEAVRILAITRRRVAAIVGGVNPSWSVEHEAADRG